MADHRGPVRSDRVDGDCLNSYAWTLMAIFFLQSVEPPICPNLQKPSLKTLAGLNLSGVPKEFAGGCDHSVWFLDTDAPFQAGPRCPPELQCSTRNDFWKFIAGPSLYSPPEPSSTCPSTAKHIGTAMARTSEETDSWSESSVSVDREEDNVRWLQKQSAYEVFEQFKLFISTPRVYDILQVSEEHVKLMKRSRRSIVVDPFERSRVFAAPVAANRLSSYLG
eukprot:GHVQ01036794.1.p1 GENE.GHVQ01036794.1~~GHVQ01036794.1.p1  ORF type:complete len:222 (-),score=20.07 GHVQ01036794.1:1431-2096(-)